MLLLLLLLLYVHLEIVKSNDSRRKRSSFRVTPNICPAFTKEALTCWSKTRWHRVGGCERTPNDTCTWSKPLNASVMDVKSYKFLWFCAPERERNCAVFVFSSTSTKQLQVIFQCCCCCCYWVLGRKEKLFDSSILLWKRIRFLVMLHFIWFAFLSAPTLAWLFYSDGTNKPETICWPVQMTPHQQQPPQIQPSLLPSTARSLQRIIQEYLFCFIWFSEKEKEKNEMEFKKKKKKQFFFSPPAVLNHRKEMGGCQFQLR